MALMNAPYVLREIETALRKLAEAGETKILDLEHFPLSDDDAGMLEEVLGKGQITISANGPDVTEWRETSIPGVWWGEYRTGPAKVSLRTIEITEIPELARAQAEDIQEGLTRLQQALEAKMGVAVDGQSHA